ncbi:hypothetical protein K7432_012703, partial [Basidiobolus ranarum]
CIIFLNKVDTWLEDVLTDPAFDVDKAIQKKIRGLKMDFLKFRCGEPSYLQIYPSYFKKKSAIRQENAEMMCLMRKYAILDSRGAMEKIQIMLNEDDVECDVASFRYQ